jgi:uncharacterized protein (DUF885 family)
VRSTTVLLAFVTLAGCSRQAPFGNLSEEFVYTNLSFSPVGATSVGYHRHNNIVLDAELDDVSMEGIQRQRDFNERFRKRLQEEIRVEELSPDDRADYGIIQDQIALTLLEINRIQNWQHNPTLYVELIGNALFQPYVLEYADRPTRYRHIISRLQKIPLLLDRAKINLSSSPDIWTRVATEENEGTIGLIDHTLRKAAPPELAEDYSKAAEPALKALRDFHQYLKTSLALRSQWDWRLGREKYVEKFRHALATDLSPEEVLANAEHDLGRVRARMLEISEPLHKEWFAAHGDHHGDPARQQNVIVSEVLDRIAERHATPATYVSDAERDLREAREFVKAKGFLTLPPRDNLQVIETPEFMRGIYAVGGFASAPALEPHLGAFYWITPIPRDWSKERIDSKLREYNYYKLKLLTIHEAMPGHYVQLEFANDVQPQARRILRGVYGNGPYIEGWGQYATEMMLDQGFLNNSPELRLTFLKEELRVLANAILDIRLHMLGMTDEEALRLMMDRTFQEREEATAKLQRAKLSSCQLPTYLVGWRDWIRVREQYKTYKGSGFNLRDFNDNALKAGAVPLPALARLLTGSPLYAIRSAPQ